MEGKAAYGYYLETTKQMQIPGMGYGFVFLFVIGVLLI